MVISGNPSNRKVINSFLNLFILTIKIVNFRKENAMAQSNQIVEIYLNHQSHCQSNLNANHNLLLQSKVLMMLVIFGSRMKANENIAKS